MCEIPMEIGVCLDNDVEVERWFYNLTSNTCEKFMYSGCGGNLNNFKSQAVCERICVTEKVNTIGKSQFIKIPIW
jgi:hypothetical protein